MFFLTRANTHASVLLQDHGALGGALGALGGALGGAFGGAFLGAFLGPLGGSVFPALIRPHDDALGGSVFEPEQLSYYRDADDK